jgi:hypothetical protein
MRQIPALFLLLSCSLSAQVMIDANRAAEILNQFESKSGTALQCEIAPIAPALTFSSRLQAGYLARVPLNQYRGAGHWISALIRVTPRQFTEKRSFYLLRTFDLPDVPNTDLTAQLAGVFLVGDGHYQSNALLFDDTHRICRADWQIDVKSGFRRILMPPEFVMSISDTSTGAWTPTSDAKLESLTVMLHAAPLNPAQINMQAVDVVMAISSLMALLDQMPARSVRLVVFNLRQDKELYRTQSFTANDIEPLTRVLDNLQLGMVDYRALQNSHREVIHNLVHRELSEVTRSEKVVFLGPDATFERKNQPLQAEMFPPDQHVFYLQYRMNGHWGDNSQATTRNRETEPRPMLPCQAGSLYGCNNGGNSATSPSAPPIDVLNNQSAAQVTASEPDAIANSVRKIKAKTFVIRNANDFAAAIEKIARY